MSFPRYERYKDSGMEWVGNLPSSWSINKIKFNTYVKGRVGWHGLNSNEFSDVGIHLITGTDFENGFVSWDKCYRISEQRYIEDPYIQLRENDLLITKDGTIGKLARVKGLPEQASLNSGIFLVRANDGTYLEDFLYWVLQSFLFAHFMDLHKVGSTIQHLYQEVFNQFAFPIPSIPEQKTIAAFLDRETAKIDALIAEQQRLIELLKEKRQSVISHAVTKGLNPNAPMKDSGIECLGKVPEHWEVCALRRLLSVPLANGIFKKKDDFGDGVLLVNVFDVYQNDFKIKFEQLDRVKCSPDEAITYQVLPEDLFFVRSSLKQEGIAAVVVAGISAEEVVFECHLIRARPKQSTVNSRYCSYLLNSPIYRAKMIAKAKITTMTTIDQETILSTILPQPPKEEQQTIAAFLDRETAKLDTFTAEAKTAITLLQERRTALISAAVTGKIDVRGAGLS